MIYKIQTTIFIALSWHSSNHHLDYLVQRWVKCWPRADQLVVVENLVVGLYHFVERWKWLLALWLHFHLSVLQSMPISVRNYHLFWVAEWLCQLEDNDF